MEHYGFSRIRSVQRSGRYAFLLIAGCLSLAWFGFTGGVAASGDISRSSLTPGQPAAAPFGDDGSSNINLNVNMPNSAARSRLVANYGQLPLRFEANQGQTDAQVKFLSRGSGYTLLLTGNEAVFALNAGRSSSIKRHPGLSFPSLPWSRMTPRLEHRPPAMPATNSETHASVLHMKLVGADSNARVSGLEELPGRSNYFIGNDPKKWRTDVINYAKVKYENVYPGVDLVYYGNQQQLEYDLVVAPGADPDQIQLAVGADQSTVPDINASRNESISINSTGDLEMRTADRTVLLCKPVVYQLISGVGRKYVDVSYVLSPPSDVSTKLRVVSFRPANYDRGEALVIDPVIIYSTGFGGDVVDSEAIGIAVDASGSAYITGDTASSNFPAVSALQSTKAGGYNDVFVSKLTNGSSGLQLAYSTYLGGSNNEYGLAIAVDSANSAYVSGGTSSEDFPAVNPLPSKWWGGSFVSKLNAMGNELVFSTRLGGSNKKNPDIDIYDGILDLALDSAGNVYVVGYASTTDFPIVNPLPPPSNTVQGPMDAFLSKLRFSGTTLSLVYSTFLGGSDWDSASGICVNTSGDVFVLGQTWSTDFPTVNPLPAPNNVLQGSGNIFVSRVSFSGSSLNLVYSTYLGGSSDGANLCTNCWGAHRIALDASGNVYVTGTTASTDFPVVNPLPGANNFLHGPADAFVSKLSFSGSALSLAFSTYLGGSGYDAGTAIAVDSSGNVYVTGATGSIDFPTVNPLPVRDGVGSFVTKLRPSGSTFNPVYSTYFAPTSSMVVDSGGNVYVSGTRYGGFPIVNPLPSPVFTPNGVMVAKISPETVVGPDTTPPLVTPIISGTSGNNGWYRSNVTLSWSVTDPESGIASSTGCAPAALTSDTAGTKITCSATNGAGLSTSASVTIKIDQTLPPVVLFGIIGGPPKQVQMSSIDVTSGLQTIQVPTCTNCTASTGAFTPGTKNAVITTATKTDATKGSSVKVVATDMAGNSTIFDPVDMTIQGEGKPEVHTLSISSLERVVQITNGNPGIHHMMLKVNQVEIPVSPLKNGERRSFDIGYALRAGQNNLITLTAFGGRQATAWIVFTEP